MIQPDRRPCQSESRRSIEVYKTTILVREALWDVLSICKKIYRNVVALLPQFDQKDSMLRQYATLPELLPYFFSLIFCILEKTKVQLEHLDDSITGAGALWGLADGQYVIVWIHSYEMNLELERIAKFREHLMSRKPADWSEENFWNLVASVHLENKLYTIEGSKVSQDPPGCGRFFRL